MSRLTRTSPTTPHALPCQSLRVPELPVIPRPGSFNWIPDLVRISLATRSHFIVLFARPPCSSSRNRISAVLVVGDMINEPTPGLNCRMRCLISEFQSWKGDFVAVPHWRRCWPPVRLYCNSPVRRMDETDIVTPILPWSLSGNNWILDSPLGKSCSNSWEIRLLFTGPLSKNPSLSPIQLVSWCTS